MIGNLVIEEHGESPCQLIYHGFGLAPVVGDEEDLSRAMEEGSSEKGQDLKLTPELFRDNSLSKGGSVKESGTVLITRDQHCNRTPNVNCRVEAFGRIMETCVVGGLKRRWVMDIGFGGLMNLAYKQLPRTLCYWLMTRVDPLSEMFIANDGKEYRFSRRQVGWVLGIRSGVTKVPRKPTTDEMRGRVIELERRYGRDNVRRSQSDGNGYRSRVIIVTKALISRLVGDWDANEEVEFKILFLLAALSMVLCPTQAVALSTDLLPGATCAMEADQYDWASLVLEKLMDSVKSFAKKFYADGYAIGCGGCSIFLAVFYLDRLNRNPIKWGIGPRIRVWKTEEWKKACREDRICPAGDFGKLGCVDVAYGELHPREARDADAEWLFSDNVADDIPDATQRSRSERRSSAHNSITARKKRKLERERQHCHLSGSRVVMNASGSGSG